LFEESRMVSVYTAVSNKKSHSLAAHAQRAKDRPTDLGGLQGDE